MAERVERSFSDKASFLNAFYQYSGSEFSSVPYTDTDYKAAVNYVLHDDYYVGIKIDRSGVGAFYVLLEDVYLYGSDLEFGYKESTLFVTDYVPEHIILDVSNYTVYGRENNNIKFYVRPTGDWPTFTMRYSCIETQNVSSETSGNVGYVYIMPNYYYKASGGSYAVMNETQLQANLDYMREATYDSVNNCYNYGTVSYSYGESLVGGAGIHMNGIYTRFKIESTGDYMRGIRRHGDSYLFFIAEGPTTLELGDDTEFNAVFYSPNKNSSLYLTNGDARSTGNDSTSDNSGNTGGSYVVGVVVTYDDYDGRTVYRSLNADETLIAKLIAGLVIETVQTEETQTEWVYSGFD
jgi:hypothetical protein